MPASSPPLGGFLKYPSPVMLSPFRVNLASADGANAARMGRPLGQAPEADERKGGRDNRRDKNKEKK